MRSSEKRFTVAANLCFNQGCLCGIGWKHQFIRPFIWKRSWEQVYCFVVRTRQDLHFTFSWDGWIMTESWHVMSLCQHLGSKVCGLMAYRGNVGTPLDNPCSHCQTAKSHDVSCHHLGGIDWIDIQYYSIDDSIKSPRESQDHELRYGARFWINPCTAFWWHGISNGRPCR
jgi:hypothetical protein